MFCKPINYYFKVILNELLFWQCIAWTNNFFAFGGKKQGGAVNWTEYGALISHTNLQPFKHKHNVETITNWSLHSLTLDHLKCAGIISVLVILFVYFQRIGKNEHLCYDTVHPIQNRHQYQYRLSLFQNKTIHRYVSNNTSSHSLHEKMHLMRIN